MSNSNPQSTVDIAFTPASSRLARLALWKMRPYRG